MRGRIRTVKPEAFLDEALWDLEQETGLPIFRAFAGLWTQADREGRFEWRPRALKAAVLPYWEGDLSRVLDALATRGFLVRYEVEGREYGLVKNFKRHQAINNKEQPSALPPPPSETTEKTAKVSRVPNACPTRAENSRGEGKGRERKGREAATAVTRGAAAALAESGTFEASNEEAGQDATVDRPNLKRGSILGAGGGGGGQSEPKRASEAIRGLGDDPPPEPKIPCPPDLALTEPQRMQLEMGRGMEPWQIDELANRFVAKALADPSDVRTLAVWRKCLASAVSGDFGDPRKRPRRPEPDQQDVEAQKLAENWL